MKWYKNRKTRKLYIKFGDISTELNKKSYRCDVGLLGGSAGLEFPIPYGVRGVTGNAGVSGREPPIGDNSGSVSDRYDENDSSRTC